MIISPDPEQLPKDADEALRQLRAFGARMSHDRNLSTWFEVCLLRIEQKLQEIENGSRLHPDHDQR